MKCWLLSATLLCVVSLGSPEALAFVEDPYITPPHPTPDDAISVHVRMGWCHGSLDAVDGAKLEVVAPGKLRLITNGVVLDPGHPLCNDPPFNYRFDIGMLPKDAYTLQFFIRDDLGGAGLVGFGNVSFVVATPAGIPATSTFGLTLMSAAFCALGAIAWRRRSRASRYS